MLCFLVTDQTWKGEKDPARTRNRKGDSKTNSPIQEEGPVNAPSKQRKRKGILNNNPLLGGKKKSLWRGGGEGELDEERRMGTDADVPRIWGKNHHLKSLSLQFSSRQTCRKEA